MLSNGIRKGFAALLATFIIIPFGLTGCGRLQAPNKKLDYSVYSPQGSISGEARYVIGVRDELEVLVWRCPELDSTVIVRPQDGNITVPLVGDVKASGKTPKELAEAISKKMVYYVKEPRIAVGVKKFGEKKVFVLGQVLAQGTYQLEKEDRIIDLVTRAGGFTESAMPSTTYIIRGDYENPEIVRTNVARLIKMGDISQNVYLMEGDIVYVPEEPIEDINAIFRKLFPALFFSEKVATLKYNIMEGGFDYHEVWNKMGKEGPYK